MRRGGQGHANADGMSRMQAAFSDIGGSYRQPVKPS